MAEYAETLPDVAAVVRNKYTCADPGQNEIKKAIVEYNLNRVVVASCTPKIHEPTFRACVAEAGLNSYLMEMANIREQVAWVTEDNELATEKAKALVNAAVKKVSYHQPLDVMEVSINPKTLVVGAGIAGIQAALEIANSGHFVYLVERDPSIGGHMAQLDKTFPALDCSA